MACEPSAGTADPVLDDVFIHNFPYYFQTAVRLRRLSMAICHREYEDIRSLGLQNYLECDRTGMAREKRMRQAVRAISRACYSQVERFQRRRCESLPASHPADRRPDPLERVQRRELRSRIERIAPEIGGLLLSQECYHSTGRLSKSAVMRRSGVSRRRLVRSLGRLQRSLGRLGN